MLASAYIRLPWRLWMNILVWITPLMHGLCILLVLCVNGAAFYGIRARRALVDRQLIAETHIAIVFLSLATVSAIVYVVEDVIRPHLARHFSLLFDVHLFFCGCFIVSGLFAIISGLSAWRSRDGKRPWHHIPARLTWTFGNFVAITGWFVTSKLRPF